MRIVYQKKLIATAFGRISHQYALSLVADHHADNSEFSFNHNELSLLPDSESERLALVSQKTRPYSTLEICQQWALLKTNERHAESLRKLSGNASDAERDTWLIQRDAAKAYLANNADDMQISLLNALLVNDESINDLCTKIIAKNNAVQLLIGMAGGVKRKTEKAIEAAVTLDEIDAALDTAKTDMAAAIEQFKAATGEANG